MLEFVKNNKGEVLNLFFKDVDRKYYLREIARILGKEPGYYQKIINDLVKEGILIDERRGNLRFFWLNKNYSLYEEIKKMISKTIGVEGSFKELVNKLNNVKCAFIFGSFAEDKQRTGSDIDLMLIGEINQDILIKEINKLEVEFNREINYQIFSKKEAVDRLNNNDNFFVNIFNKPMIILKGNINDFRQS